MPQLISRMIRAARLDTTLYDEVKADNSALGQAIGVVILTFVAGVIGSFGRDGLTDAREVIISLIFWFVLWFVAAFSLYFVGTEFTGEQRTRSSAAGMLRTVGFSFTPGVVHVLGIVPGLSVVAKIVAALWAYATIFIAVRQTLDIRSIGRTIGVLVIAGFGGSAIMFVLVHTVYIPVMR